jgi:hypothetical protein
MKAKKVQSPAVSAAHMQALKRASQARDHALVASGAVPPEAMLLIRPEMLRGAIVEWPKESLLDQGHRSPPDGEPPADGAPAARSVDD